MAQKRLPTGVRLGKDGRYHWELDRVRPDGSRWRKAGSAKTASEAQRKRKLAEQEFEQSSALGAGRMTVGEWCDFVMTSLITTVPSKRGRQYAAKTVEGYAQCIDHHIKPLLGDILLSALTASHIDAALASISTAPTKRKIVAVGSVLFTLAVDRRLIAQNPWSGIRIVSPRPVRTEQGHVLQTVRVLTQDEEQTLLDNAKGHWAYIGILLGFRCGLRVGEIIGLEWTAINLEQRTITINQQRSRVTSKTRELMGIQSKTGLVASEPKSKTSVRTIPMPKSVYDALSQIRGTAPHGRWLMPNIHNTGPREPRRFAHALEMLSQVLPSVDQHGNPLPIVTPHDLRRTFCTRMALHYSTPPAVLAAIAGHSDITVTLKYYVHADYTSVQDAMSKMP